MFKLEQNGISGNFRLILQDNLDERKERVVLKGQAFSWANVTVQFLFICVNDLLKGLHKWNPLHPPLYPHPPYLRGELGFQKLAGRGR